ncbi:MAG TPA: aminotransferase class IV [Candidatus Krumholzibacteriaceae bacterium]|nr:aminotransferase class IV [Candidatus Krumholzibacteriaceae bacterium]
MAEPLIYVNGELVPKSEAKISVFDEGVTHGWAVYEGIRVYDGRIVELDAHMKRLYGSAKGAGIKIPLSPNEFRDAVIETVRANGYRDCHLAPWVGYGEVGGEPNVVIRIREVGTRMGEPLTVVVSSVRRAAPDSIPAQIKTNSRLDLMLAKVEAQVAGADYAIMLDHMGYVAEASLANLMIVKNDVVYTPCATSALEGVTRNLLLCLLPMNGVEACEGSITLQDLWTADEAFICGTGAEIRPMTMIDGRRVGDGGTGPVTRKAIRLYETYVRENGEQIRY